MLQHYAGASATTSMCMQHAMHADTTYGVHDTQAHATPPVPHTHVSHQCSASMVLNMLFTLAQLIVTDTGSVSEQNRISQPDCTYDMSRDRSRSPALPRIPSDQANATGGATLHNARSGSSKTATSSNTQHTTYSKLAF